MGPFHLEEQAWESSALTRDSAKSWTTDFVVSFVLPHPRRITLKRTGTSFSLALRQHRRYLIFRDDRFDLARGTSLAGGRLASSRGSATTRQRQALRVVSFLMFLLFSRFLCCRIYPHYVPSRSVTQSFRLGRFQGGLPSPQLPSRSPRISEPRFFKTVSLGWGVFYYDTGASSTSYIALFPSYVKQLSSVIPFLTTSTPCPHT